MYLGDSRTCVYDDGTTLSMDAGPCQPVLSSGAYLVDDVTEAEGGILRIMPEADMPWPALTLAGLALLFATTRKRRQ